MYEHGAQPLLPRRLFAQRILAHLGTATVLVLVSLLLGMAGYHWLARETWIDAFVNSAMLLGGMGQVGDVTSTAGKLFAGWFALYAGLVLIASFVILVTPVLHRVIHRIHLEGKSR